MGHQYPGSVLLAIQIYGQLPICLGDTVQDVYKRQAVNKYLLFLGRPDCRVRPLRLQRKLFRDAGRDLDREEYSRLTAAARAAGKERLALLMERCV